MSTKDELVDALDRLAQVVEIELELMQTWKDDAATTDGRRAEIRLASNYVGVGFSSALRRTAHALNEAKSLGDESVLHGPGDAHLRAVQAAVDSIADRVEWPGPALSDESFTLAINMARDNSDGAAEVAEAIYADCVHPVSAGVPAGGHAALIAAPAALATMVAEVNRKRKSPTGGKPKSPKKTGPK